MKISSLGLIQKKFKDHCIYEKHGNALDADKLYCIVANRGVSFGKSFLIVEEVQLELEEEAKNVE